MHSTSEIQGNLFRYSSRMHANVIAWLLGQSGISSGYRTAQVCEKQAECISSRHMYVAIQPKSIRVSFYVVEAWAQTQSVIARRYVTFQFEITKRKCSLSCAPNLLHATHGLVSSLEGNVHPNCSVTISNQSHELSPSDTTHQLN